MGSGPHLVGVSLMFLKFNSRPSKCTLETSMSPVFRFVSFRFEFYLICRLLTKSLWKLETFETSNLLSSYGLLPKSFIFNERFSWSSFFFYCRVWSCARTKSGASTRRCASTRTCIMSTCRTISRSHLFFFPNHLFIILAWLSGPIGLDLATTQQNQT